MITEINKNMGVFVFMISLDHSRCKQCGFCIERFKGYCITSKDGYPIFNQSLCNTCQKCVAICPTRAILVNRTVARKIQGPLAIKPEDLLDLFQRRRSIKRFQNRPVEKNILLQIVRSASYAPNQNKNISAVIITDQGLLSEINLAGLRFVRFFYNLLFRIPLLSRLFGLISRNFKIIRTKMEYDLKITGQVVKPNTQALIVLTGPKSVPVTAESAHYLLSAMLYTAEVLGVGSCLMDSLKVTLNIDKKIRKLTSLSKNVLGVLALGYSDEKIVNIPQGYELAVSWIDQK